MFYNSNDLLEIVLKFAGVPFLSWVMSVVAIFMSILLNAVIAVPFWLCWTVLGIGAQYCSFLPSIYQSISLWHCMNIFICIGLIKIVVTHRNFNVNVKE